MNKEMIGSGLYLTQAPSYKLVYLDVCGRLLLQIRSHMLKNSLGVKNVMPYSK